MHKGGKDMYFRQSKPSMITKHSTMQCNHLERDWPVQLTCREPHTFSIVVVLLLMLTVDGWGG